MMKIIKLFIKRLFCNHENIYEVNRFPNKGTTGKGKVWHTYWCPDCKRYYCGNEGFKLFKVSGPDDFVFKMSIGGK